MNLQPHLHIVSFDVPYPPDYGGVAAVLHKIKSLHKEGVKIILHCFNYGRGEAPQLEAFCQEVIYYKRNTGLKGLRFLKPYIVSSRINKTLINNLNKDNAPIIFEGTHTTGIIPFLHNKQRKIVVRLHNIEASYYKTLSFYEPKFLNKLYYKVEAFLLKKYENKLFKSQNLCFYAINNDEAIYLKTIYPQIKVQFLPPFNGWELGVYKKDRGLYCLYHGNLSVAENIATVEYVLKNIVAKSKRNFVFAGKNPPAILVKKIHSYPNACIIESPDWYEMDELIQNAQICIIPSLGSHGVKLKLLHSLYLSKHCIVTQNVIAGTLLDGACVVTNTDAAMITEIDAHMEIPFLEQDWEHRREILARNYNNKVNAQKIILALHLHCQ